MLYKLIITLTLLAGLDQLTTNLDITDLLGSGSTLREL